MKLAFVEVAGFRGFKDRTRFNLPAGFVVLTGRNGAGKSTVLDAVDFVLTGTISKYAVTGARGGGLEEHIWWIGEGAPEQYVTVGFVADDGKELVVTRSRDRGLDTSIEELSRRLCIGEPSAQAWPETLMQTTLIRDETIAGLSLDLPEQARFAAVRAAIGGLAGPDHSERTSALLRSANAAKVEQERRVDETQAELSRALTALTEARSIVERQADLAEAERIIAALAPDLGTAPGDRAEMLRRHVAEGKRSISALEEAIDQARRLQEEQLSIETEIDRARADAALQEGERTEKGLEEDAFVWHMVALLDHGEALGLQDGHCPLCEAVRSSSEFAAAIAAARARLSTRVAQGTAALRVADLEARRMGLKHDLTKIAAVFDRWSLAASPAEPENARRLLLRRQEETAQLEHAVFILEASSAHDRVTALEARVEQLRTQLDEETAKLTAAERAVESARQIENAAKSVANQILTEQFDTVMPLLKELYQRLRPHTDWREIETDFGGRVRASLNFTVGEGRNPQFLFSSGQRRAAGIAFLLAIHLSRPWCRWRSLMLDDPVQHIDDYRALNLVEVLSAVRRTGRQVIVAVEDPALADVLCRRLRSTAVEGGRRFELGAAPNGSAAIERQIDIFPLPQGILEAAEVSP